MIGKPVRLRLSRRAGLDLQRASKALNGRAAVNVARPFRWGNSYRVAQFGRELAITLFEKALTAGSMPFPETAQLRGKNFACWCAPDRRRHADVLLRIANGKGRRR